MSQRKRVEKVDPVSTAVEAIRDALHQACKDLPPAQFKEVLEEISADIEGHLDSLKEEAEEGEDG